MAKSLKQLPAPQADTSYERIQMSIRLRFNPIRNLTPDLLSQYLDQFRLGFFRQAALAWEAMERRDSRLMTVAPKRKKSVARHGWEILTVDDSAAALAQKTALEYFFNNLTATTALEPDEKGGMSLLIRQMMDAVGKRYAVHEITWQPSPAGLTAQFTFCPLWWFEGTRGKLRYLVNEMSIYGQEMDEYGWLVTVGDGLMEACSVAYIFKSMPLKDWVNFAEKFGMPGLLGTTDAAIGSTEWEAMVEAVKNFASDWAAVTQRGKIELLEVKGSGESPFKPLVDMMNDEMTRLWRGADLGTASKADSVGATLQESETDILQDDDAEMIGETLTGQVSRYVLQYYFGDAPQLAYLRIKTAEKPNVAQELLVDDWLVKNGAPRAIKDVLEMYNRPVPDPGEPLLKAPAPPPMPGAPGKPGDPATEPEGKTEQANAANDPIAPTPGFADAANAAVAKAISEDHAPLWDALNSIADITDPDLQQARLLAWLKRANAYVAQLDKDSAAQHAFAEILASSFANGLAKKEPKA